ncbi:hypothetical protein SAMN06295879_2004 [Agreia bicolorata]|uniref:LPXTG-motif cell wall anchor domain-containing protein n=1 Tax=Agreia bicolorata TaxID=110935 RepID=A0A1T4Y1I1_9MICO|nr:hypothetical protein [Agreia bicolorata]SKA95483.1 hypothetical protein SAMN06295879_2004 [Agreia bicolorata]
MHNSRLRATLATGLATLVVGLISIGSVAAPASAASAADGRTLYKGSSLYAISCDEDVAALTLFSIDAATAAATAIGAGTPESEAECAGQAAWNPVTSTAYLSEWLLGPSALATVDLHTGVSTQVAPFTLNGEFNGIDSMAIGNDGAAYAIQDDMLYSLDLETAALTEIGELDADSMLGFSVDPTTGKFYAIDRTGQVFQIDVEAAVATPIGNVGLERGTYSLQIDTSGVLWIEADVRVGEGEARELTAQLWSANLGDLSGSTVFSGTIADSEQTVYTESLLLLPGPFVPVTPVEPAPPVVDPAVVTPPAPQLANTGVDAAPLAAGGALVALLGVALLVPAIRRRRRASA